MGWRSGRDTETDSGYAESRRFSFPERERERERGGGGEREGGGREREREIMRREISN